MRHPFKIMMAHDFPSFSVYYTLNDYFFSFFTSIIFDVCKMAYRWLRPLKKW